MLFTSNTDALLYTLQAIYEAVDTGEAGARLFFADFSKGFDLIDHTILLHELENLQVHPALLNWIAAFLTNRKQAVKIDGVLSDWTSVKGGVPQGTKLGVILFIVMTNKLLWEWNLRTICLRQLKSCKRDPLPEIWDKMATDMRTLTKYGDQILL